MPDEFCAKVKKIFCNALLPVTHFFLILLNHNWYNVYLFDKSLHKILFGLEVLT